MVEHGGLVGHGVTVEHGGYGGGAWQAWWLWKWCMVGTVSMVHNGEHGRSWWNKVHYGGSDRERWLMGPGGVTL